MTPTERRPAELDDADRAVGRTFTEDEFVAWIERTRESFNTLVYERFVAEQRANLAVWAERQRRAKRRKLYRLVFWWTVSCLAFAGLSFYLRRFN